MKTSDVETTLVGVNLVIDISKESDFWTEKVFK